MIYAYFTSNNNHLINSLKRYFHFLLSQEINDIKNISCTVDNLFVFEDEKDIDAIINLVQNMEIKKVYILGYNKISKPNYINLIDLTKLGKTFQDTMVSKESNKNLFGFIHITAFKEKLNLFFKGHGEESLFDGLNWTRYFISNGLKLFLLGDIKITELKNKFLEPGFDYWEKFKQRFNKYNPYLKLLNASDRLLIIEKNINSFNLFLDNLKSALSNKTNNLTLDENKINGNLGYLMEIDEIVNSIYREVVLGASPK